MKRLNADRLKEVDQLADWCEFFMRFVYERPDSRDRLDLALSGIRRPESAVI